MTEWVSASSVMVYINGILILHCWFKKKPHKTVVYYVQGRDLRLGKLSTDFTLFIYLFINLLRQHLLITYLSCRCTKLLFDTYIHYSMLTTKNLVSIHHHIFEPLPLTTFLSGNHQFVCIYEFCFVCSFACFFV